MSKPFRPFVKNKAGNQRMIRDNYGSNWYGHVDKITKRDGAQCNDCLVKAGPGVHFHVHHAIPLSRGGTTSAANTLLLCDKCHERRHPHMQRATRPPTRRG